MGKDAVRTPSTVERESPRTVTRGLDSQNGSGGSKKASADVLGIHWLRGSIPDTMMDWLTAKLRELWGDDYEVLEHGFWVYDRHKAWPSGVKLLFHSTEEGSELTLNRIALEVPGSAIEQLDMRAIVSFMAALSIRQFQCSRLDVYFDDLQRTVTPAQLYQVVWEESLFEGLPLRHDVIGFKRCKRVIESNRQGRVHDEVAFGRRGKEGSGKYLRVYDKYLESKGETLAVRWELELSDHHARKAFASIVRTMDDLGAGPWKQEWTADVLGGLIRWCVDFKKRVAGVKNLDRLERYAFWQSILARLGFARLACRRIVKAIDKARDWVCRGVAGTLQMLRKALGDEVAIPMICDLAFGEDRLRPAHKRAIAEYLRLKAPEPVPVAW